MATNNASPTAWSEDPYVTPWPEMRPFWEAAHAGRFLVPHCQACGEYHWHPRTVCPYCHSTKIEWLEASGRGTIYSFSIARTWSPPHVVAFVKLQEGPTLLTQIVDCDLESMRVDLPVQVKLAPVEGGRSMPFFTPAKA